MGGNEELEGVQNKIAVAYFQIQSKNFSVGTK
jgi:hypothetical protein